MPPIDDELIRLILTDRRLGPPARMRTRRVSQAYTWFDSYSTAIIRRHMARLGLSDIDSDDWIQHIKSALLARLPKLVYDPTPGRFEAWMKTTTYRLLLDLARKSSRPPRFTHLGADVYDLADRDVPPTANYLRRRVPGLIRRVLARYARSNPKNAEIIHLCYLEDCPVKEAALRTGLTSHEVSCRLDRARRDLFRLLKSDSEFPLACEWLEDFFGKS